MKKIVFLSLIILVLMVSFCFADETYYLKKGMSELDVKLKGGESAILNYQGLSKDNGEIYIGSNSYQEHTAKTSSGTVTMTGDCFTIEREQYEHILTAKYNTYGYSIYYIDDNYTGERINITVTVYPDNSDNTGVPFLSNEDLDRLKAQGNQDLQLEPHHYDDNGNEISITVQLSQQGDTITASSNVLYDTLDRYDYFWADISIQNVVVQYNFEHLYDTNVIPLPQESGHYLLTVVGITKSGIRSENASLEVTLEYTVTQTTSPTATPAPSSSATPTNSPRPSSSVTPTSSPKPSNSVTPTSSPKPSNSVTPTNSPVPSATVTPTVEPTTTPTVTPTEQPTIAPTESPTPTPTTTPTPEPTDYQPSDVVSDQPSDVVSNQPSDSSNGTPSNNDLISDLGETAELPFIDVYKEDEFYEAIKYVYTHEIFKGMEEDYFGQIESMTRGMMVTVLYRLDGASESSYATFEDVPASMYYSQPIAWANKNGIVIGIGDNKYDPEKALSRQDLATIISRYINFRNMNIANVSEAALYSDESDVADYAISPVRTVIQKGIMMTNDYACFEPVRPGTRAEIAYAMMILGKAR